MTGPSSPTSNSALISAPAGVINVEIVEAKGTLTICRLYELHKHKFIPPGLVNKDLSLLSNDKSDPYAVVELKADGEVHTFKTEVMFQTKK